MKNALLIFFIALGAYLLTAGGHLYSPDEEILFRVTQSIVEDGDLAIERLDPSGFATMRGPDGREYAQYGIGQALFAVPFYLAGRLAAPLAEVDTWRRVYGIAPGEPSGARGYPLEPRDLATRFACSFFNIFFSAALAAVMFLLMKELIGREEIAFFAALVYALGTLQWAHSRPFFTETGAVGFAVLAWYALLRAARTGGGRWYALAGAATGFSALTRMDATLMFPGIGILLLDSAFGETVGARRPMPAAIRSILLFCLPAMACGFVFLLLNKIRFGGFLANGYTDQPEGVKFTTPVMAGLFGFIFTPGKGLFFFSPPLVLTLYGWGAFARRSRVRCAAAAVCALIPFIAMSKWQNWAGGWCWGPRHIVMIHPFLMLAVVAWLAEVWGPVRRTIAAGLLVVGIGVQLFGCSQDFMLFHNIYFRAPGRNYKVMFDGFDQTYWAKYYHLRVETEPGAPAIDVPLQHTPAPIQHSLYIPQSSMWDGYPRMWNQYGLVDNLWIRLMRGE